MILDLGLPDLDGLEVLEGLRERGSAVPVLVFSARGRVDDRVIGLNLGADDYLGKPFAFEELLASVRANLRQCAGSGVRRAAGRCGTGRGASGGFLQDPGNPEARPGGLGAGPHGGWPDTFGGWIRSGIIGSGAANSVVSSSGAGQPWKPTVSGGCLRGKGGGGVLAGGRVDGSGGGGRRLD